MKHYLTNAEPYPRIEELVATASARAGVPVHVETGPMPPDGQPYALWASADMWSLVLDGPPRDLTRFWQEYHALKFEARI